MATMALQVFEWPQPAALQHGLLLVSCRRPTGTSREHARAGIREAIVDALVQILEIPAQCIVITSHPGRAPQLAVPGFAYAGLSISHEHDRSVAAVNLFGNVGVDLMLIQDIPDWLAVAQDYLGPQAVASLNASAAQQRARRFAMLWCEREAQLKYQGQALREWPFGGSEGARCQMLSLALGDAMVGTVAMARR